MTNHIDDISQRKSAIIVGALILIAYIMVGSFYFGSLIIVMLLELISAAAMIAMGFLMFPILKPENKNLALGYVVCRIIDGLIFIIAGIILLPLIITAGSSDSSTLILGVRVWVYIIVDYSFGIGFLILSYLLYQLRLVPRFISAWGIIASTWMLAAVLLNLLSPVIPFEISHLPMILNEVFLAIWLIVKGFNEDAIISGAVKTDIN